MKRGQIFGLILSATAASAAYVTYHRAIRHEKPNVVVVKPQTEEILVATRTLPQGTDIEASDLAWKKWPKDLIPAQSIERSSATAPPPADLLKARARIEIAAGEPVRHSSVSTKGTAGYLASVLRPGYRAVAIVVDSKGGATAGNFILPDDHVDVLQTYEAFGGGPDRRMTFESKMIVANVRVLAIGNATLDHRPEKMASGGTATLEVTPEEAERLAQAQRRGQLSLALRSAAQDPADLSLASNAKPGEVQVGVVRNGVRQEYSVPDQLNRTDVPQALASAVVH